MKKVVVILILIFAVIGTSFAQAGKASPPQKAPEANKVETEKKETPKLEIDPSPEFLNKYNRLIALLGELQEVEATARFLKQRVGGLQNELLGMLPAGYDFNEQTKKFVQRSAPPTPPKLEEKKP